MACANSRCRYKNGGDRSPPPDTSYIDQLMIHKLCCPVPDVVHSLYDSKSWRGDFEAGEVYRMRRISNAGPWMANARRVSTRWSRFGPWSRRPISVGRSRNDQLFATVQVYLQSGLSKRGTSESHSFRSFASVALTGRANCDML